DHLGGDLTDQRWGAHALTVGIGHPGPAPDGDGGASFDHDLGQADVTTHVGPREHAQEAAERTLFDEDHVQEPVLGVGIGTDVDPPSVCAGVAHRHQHPGFVDAAPVHLDLEV